MKGTVIVEILVGTDGTVQSARAVLGHPLLRASAVQAARKWKFKPLKLKGRPARFIGFLPFIFTWDSDEMNKQCDGLKRVE
jgi:TonB family protein